jgi:hypothetical protein
LHQNFDRTDADQISSRKPQGWRRERIRHDVETTVPIAGKAIYDRPRGAFAGYRNQTLRPSISLAMRHSLSWGGVQPRQDVRRRMAIEYDFVRTAPRSFVEFVNERPEKADKGFGLLPPLGRCAVKTQKPQSQDRAEDVSTHEHHDPATGDEPDRGS